MTTLGGSKLHFIQEHGHSLEHHSREEHALSVCYSNALLQMWLRTRLMHIITTTSTASIFSGIPRSSQIRYSGT